LQPYLFPRPVLSTQLSQAVAVGLCLLNWDCYAPLFTFFSPFSLSFLFLSFLFFLLKDLTPVSSRSVQVVRLDLTTNPIHSTHFREACREQLESIPLGFAKCIAKALAKVRLDPGFLAFYEWAASAAVPIVVLSGGLAPLIEAMLEHLLGCEARGRIEVVANGVAVQEGFESVDEDGGAWRVVFRDDSVYGHDKARAIMPYTKHCGRAATGYDGERPVLLFAGDGISDLSAAGQSDLLFAKQGEGKSGRGAGV